MNIITRLIMDSAQYSGGLEKAQKSLDKYVEKNMTLEGVAKNVGSAIGKISVGIGAATTAGAAFNKFMESSQAKGDAMAETMEAARATIDQFFYALGAGEFNTFLNGLDEIISKSVAAQRAIDQLGNTRMSHGVRSSMNEAEIQEAQYIAKNKFAPLEERIAAFEKWANALKKQEGINKTLGSDLATALTAQIEKEIGNSNIKVSVEEALEGFDIDLINPDEGKRDQTKERIRRLYGQYVSSRESLESERRSTSSEGRRRGIDIQIAELEKVYRKEIIANAMLNKYKDEELQGIGNLIIEQQRLISSLKSMSREYNETATEFNNSNKGVKGFTPVESLEGYKVYTGSGTGSAGVGAGNKKELGVEVGYVERDLKIKTAIERTSDNKLSDEIFKAIQGDKKLPVLMQPVQELIEGGMNEGPEEVEDPALEGLRDRIGMYDTIQQKIASYKDMLKYANEEEAGYIQSQIAMWEEYANKIGSTAKEGDDLSAITGAIGQIGGALSSTGNDWLSYIGNSMSAVAQMIQVIQALTSAKSAAAIAEQATLPFPENLAAIASTIAALTSAMSSISSIGNFAEGGIVGGTNYQDGITARVSSGEMFINQADQKKLYDSIHSGNLGGGNGRAVVTGEQIVIAANNWGKRTGRGELLFSK
jgi:hypothetical protein